VPSHAHLATYEGIAAAILSEVDGDGRGGVVALKAIDGRIEDASDEVRFEILAAACRRRSWVDGLALLETQELTAIRVAAFARTVFHRPAISREALAHSLGRRWAEGVLRWREPYALGLPEIDALDEPLRQRFIAGFAEVLGERWGPGPHSVSGLNTEHVDAWDSGLARGLSRRWFSQSR
jgi:hypothetical protein